MSLNRAPLSQSATDRLATPNRLVRQRTTRRPVTRSATRVGPVTRGSPNMERIGNRLVPVIEIETSSDED